jgi:hypothetical protein
MVKKHCTHSWLGSFAGRLMQLRPDMSIGSAVHCAVEHIHHATHRDPEQAAEAFVHARFAAETAEKSDSAQTAESHSARYRTLFDSGSTASRSVQTWVAKAGRRAGLSRSAA